MNTSPKPRTWRRRLLRCFVMGLIGYVGGVIVLMLLETMLVYHPAGPEDWIDPPPLANVLDVELASATGDTIHAWWFPRPGATGAVLYFHGNAGNLSHRGVFAYIMGDELRESVLLIDYPGYGKSTGRPSEAGCCAAADAAYDWLTTTKRIRGENILIYGASLGGGVAVDLASRKPHRALILVKTFTSLPDVGARRMPWVPVRWLMRNRYESLEKIALCKQPIFIAHGDADTIVPFEQGERLFAAALGPKEFLLLPGGDHNDSLPGQLFFGALNAFLAKTAPQAAPGGN